MSSANRVRLASIVETVYGVTPGAGNFQEVRMVSEDLTGTPQIVESAELRSDRQTSGQVNTGLELSGGFDFELSADASIQTFIEQAMMSDEVAAVIHTDTLTIGGGGTTLGTLGDFVADGISDGDMVILAGFTTAENNSPVIVSNVLAASMDIVGEGLTDEAGGTSATVPAYHNIGTVEKSVSVSKEFLDVDDGNVRSIAYTGMRVNEMTMTFAFGAIATGRFSLAGNGYATPLDPITDLRTVDPASSAPAQDASNNFGWLLVDNQNIDICLENLDFTLTNNLTAQNCIGNLAPKDQILGSAGVTFNASMFLGVTSWDTFMDAKITQAPLSLAFYTRDVNGNGYGVVMDRVQVNFPDPAASGRDAQVILQSTGTASYDAATTQTMRIYNF